MPVGERRQRRCARSAGTGRADAARRAARPTAHAARLRAGLGRRPRRSHRGVRRGPALAAGGR
ncbi:MAG TPA: hypothetical protein DCQ52_08225 [Acidimicrobiaceae bacterium]|nr:hypothetical protein [Acidimicrobiaceae bacterium]